MDSRIEATIWTDDRTSSNIDRAGIYPSRVPVYHRARSQLDVDTVVGPERCAYPWVTFKEQVIIFLAGSGLWKRSRVASDSARTMILERCYVMIAVL